MSRFALALIAASLLAAPAEAASLVRKSAVAMTTESGVTVWRGAPGPNAAAPSLKPAATPRCISKTVVVYAGNSRARGLRTHGFWSGDFRTPVTGYLRRESTQGFYADRMAAGL